MTKVNKARQTIIIMMIAFSMMLSMSLTARASDNGTNLESSIFSSRAIEEAVINLFTEVIVEDPQNGYYHIDELARIKYAGEADKQQLEGIRDYLNSLQNQKNGISLTSRWDDVKCILLQATGIDAIFMIDWNLVNNWISQKAWLTLAKYLAKEIPKHAAKLGLKGAIKFNPAGLAASLVWAAITCKIA